MGSSSCDTHTCTHVTHRPVQPTHTDGLSVLRALLNPCKCVKQSHNQPPAPLLYTNNKPLASGPTHPPANYQNSASSPRYVSMRPL